MRSSLPAMLAVALVALAAPLRAQDVRAYVAADPSAPVVTPRNLLESDRFWPFHVGLVEELVASGASEPIPAVRGVLVRVESGGTLRVDFGRFGRHALPIAATDVVERANRVRRGEDTKLAPNLVLTLGNKLLDSAGDEVGPYRVPPHAAPEALLCVFADPAAEGFADVAGTLRPVTDLPGMLTLLVPHGALKDGRVRKRLRAVDWRVPFVFDRFAKGYTRSLAGEEAALPHAMLLTPDGRVLHRGAVTPGLASAVRDALRRRAEAAPAGGTRGGAEVAGRPSSDAPLAFPSPGDG